MLPQCKILATRLHIGFPIWRFPSANGALSSAEHGHGHMLQESSRKMSKKTYRRVCLTSRKLQYGTVRDVGLDRRRCDRDTIYAVYDVDNAGRKHRLRSAVVCSLSESGMWRTTNHFIERRRVVAVTPLCHCDVTSQIRPTSAIIRLASYTSRLSCNSALATNNVPCTLTMAMHTDTGPPRPSASESLCFLAAVGANERLKVACRGRRSLEGAVVSQEAWRACYRPRQQLDLIVRRPLFIQ